MRTSTSVLITGATSGIGRHAALELTQRGLTVIATGRNRTALDELKREAAAGNLHVVELDVTNPDSLTAAAAEVDRITGGAGVNVLVNNAGYGMAAPLIETSDRDLRDQFETNVFGLMAVTRTFTKKMLTRGSGRIINVSSVGGRVTFPFMGAYNASKYAVEALSDALRRELEPFGIDVIVIEPGPIRTEFASKSMDYVAKYESSHSPYALVYEKAQQIRKHTDTYSGDPACVTRAIVKAISARRPRPRYVVPLSAYVAIKMLEWLPTRITDRLMQVTVGLNRIHATD